MQNRIAGLAVIAGYILRDLYFSEELSFGVLQRCKIELEKWSANLPNPLRAQLESTGLLDSSLDQSEATVSYSSISRLEAIFLC
jgi:hypothetical protein